MLIRDYGRRRLQELDEHKKRRLMKVSENVEKGGAVLKMVSSSTDFLKGMMELSLAATAVPGSAATAVAGDVRDCSAPSVDNSTTSQTRAANGPSFAQSAAVVGSGDRAAKGRLGKGLAWLQGRCRPRGRLGSSGGLAVRGRDPNQLPQDQAELSAADLRSTAAPNTVAPRVDDGTTVPDKKQAPTSPIRDHGGGDRQTPAAAFGRVYEKRTKWLQRHRKVADADVCGGSDDTGSTVHGPPGHSQADVEPSVAISVISDSQNNGIERAICGVVGTEPLAQTDHDAQTDHNGVQCEVVLDPVALLTPVDSAAQLFDHPTSFVASLVPSTAKSQHSTSPPAQESDSRCLAAEDGIHLITPKRPDSIGSFESPLPTDHVEPPPPPLSPDVDFLCSEVGRLVAEYLQQHLASTFSAKCSLCVCFLYYYYYYYYDYTTMLQKYCKATHCKNMLLGHFTKLQKYNVPINNIQLAKRQVQQASLIHSSERQQGVQISYLGWQTVPGAHRCDRERSVAKCGTSS